MTTINYPPFAEVRGLWYLAKEGNRTSPAKDHITFFPDEKTLHNHCVDNDYVGKFWYTQIQSEKQYFNLRIDNNITSYHFYTNPSNSYPKEIKD